MTKFTQKQLREMVKNGIAEDISRRRRNLPHGNVLSREW